MRVHIVMYHYIRDLNRSRYPGIKGLETSLFLEQLEFLNSRFTIIRMEDLLAALDGGELPENAALLTFDDGYIDHYTTVFPIMDDMGIQASFFPPSTVLQTGRLLDVNKIHFILAAGAPADIYTSLIDEIEYYRGLEFLIPDTQDLIREHNKPNRFDSGEVIFIKRILQTVLPELLRGMIADKLFHRFVCVDEAVFSRELYLDVSQLTTMIKHGMFIGLHGGDHDWLGNMKQSEYEADISKALDFMDSASLVDKKAWVMNYPYGSWNDGVVEFVGKNGCQAGLTTEVTVADLETHIRWLLPRLDTNDFPPKSENYTNYSKP